MNAPETAKEGFARAATAFVIRMRDDNRALPCATETAEDQVAALWADLGELHDCDDVLAMRAAAIAELDQVQAPSHWIGIGKWAACFVCVSVLVYWISQPKPYRYTTSAGETLTIRLPDKTEVKLAPNSRLAIVIGEEQRTVTLTQGRAFFDVAHDPKRPFRVVSGNQTVQAIGTKFQVVYKAKAASVVLVEGSVQVSVTHKNRPATVLRLAPGQSVRADAASPKQHKVNVDVETAWLQGKQVFENRALGDIATEFNAFTVNKIIISDTKTASYRVSGTFNHSETATFVNSIQRTLPVSAIQTPEGDFILESRVP